MPDPGFDDVRDLREEPEESWPITKDEYERSLSEAKHDWRKDRKECPEDTLASDRELEIEWAIGHDVPHILSYVLEDEGSVRGSVRHINDVLRDMSHYDVEKYGLVSTPTFYKWVEKWADYKFADDVLKSYCR